MTSGSDKSLRTDYCPVYDIACPAGSEAAASCELRFRGDYNPLTNFRDADIEHCAIYRQAQQAARTARSETTGQPPAEKE